jgi:hypothetical protein
LFIDASGNIGVAGANWAIINGFKENASSANYAGYLSFVTRASGGAFSERARLDSSGRLLVGTSTNITSQQIQSASTGGNNFGASRFTNGLGGCDILLTKSRGATVGTHTVVQSGDDLGNLYFGGSDGSSYVNAARISAAVDGTPGSNDMPGRLVFSTTPSGSASPVERMRIDSVGRVRPSVTTLASYIYSNWTPSDVVGTATNAPSTGTTYDSEFVTLANSSGTLTITLDIAGKYLIGTRVQSSHGNTYTSDRLTLAFGGTATNLPPYAANSGDSVNDFDFCIGNSYLVSATAGQTVTVLPTYECIGAGVPANHTALCGITVLYCGG